MDGYGRVSGSLGFLGDAGYSSHPGNTAESRPVRTPPFDFLAPKTDKRLL